MEANKKITKSTFSFLKKLEKNNNRTWFAENKEVFTVANLEVKDFLLALNNLMTSHDLIEKAKLFRIYRDVRFSANKLPYKAHISGSFTRSGAALRGGYYLHIQPGASFIATGFWGPNKEDLLRIRKEFELDSEEFIDIVNQSSFKKIWGELEGDQVKTAPKGFNKEDKNIALIRKKQLVFTRKFTDSEVLADSFLDEVALSFKAVRPFLDLMSSILTTNLNGESLLKE